MNRGFFSLRTMTVTALLALGAQASGAVASYRDGVLFDTVIQSAGIDTLDDLELGPLPQATLARQTTSGSIYGYTVSVSTAEMYAVGTERDVALSTNEWDSELSLGNFLHPVTAFAVNLYSSDDQGLYTQGVITVTAKMVSGASWTQDLLGNSAQAFLGLTSANDAFASISFRSKPGWDGAAVWPTINNITFGAVAPAPEPGTLAMLFGGLAVLGAMLRSRR